ncbi:YciI family protein [Paenibacillus turpanensis]|uniref:YciI family protein n=1 Tax=Paenibacillus turpanensis TaxID=2689078 RepID=UPI00140C6D3C|nr:YciI family protein [Paenibacillus turpanensis]
MNRYFAVLLPMLDEEKSRVHRPEHLAYLDRMREEGRIFANGRFADGWGGMVIYIAENVDEAEALAKNDPFVLHGARRCEIHEWELVKGRLE